MISTHDHGKLGKSKAKQNNKIIPKSALVLYGKDSDYCALSGVTHHLITNGILREGRSVSPKEVMSLFNIEEKAPLSIKPQNVIAENDNYLIWYTQPRLEHMWFRSFGKEPKSFKVQWTPLLFIANKTKRRLNVFSLAKGEYPNANTMVYHAPLMNIGNSGSVCQGTAKLPSSIDHNSMKLIEDTIYKSNFTHVNHRQTLKIGKKESIETGDNLAFWRKRAQSNKPVSTRNLVPYKSLSELISSLN